VSLIEMLIIYPVTQSTTQLSVIDTHLSERQKGIKQYLHVFEQPFRFFHIAYYGNKQHKSTETSEAVLDSASSIYCCHKVIVLCNGRGSGHVTKSTNHIGWLVFFKMQ